jgi:hypothetical protein
MSDSFFRRKVHEFGSTKSTRPSERSLSSPAKFLTADGLRAREDATVAVINSGEEMRTDVFRAVGTDGQAHIVFRRTQAYLVRTPYGDVERQREPKFYLDNGDALECVERYDTFKSLSGNLVVKLITPKPRKRRAGLVDTKKMRSGTQAQG